MNEQARRLVELATTRSNARAAERAATAELAEAAREAVNNHEFTIYRVADIAGVSHTTVNTWIRGGR